VQFSKINILSYFFAIRLAATFLIYHIDLDDCKYFFEELVKPHLHNQLVILLFEGASYKIP
ncbi:hypothetical protein M5X11_05205, partial [Paenibacillus alginolyticus]|uniref:hypothetical protein n=1 Tax=Paenibacillus alginolyticus TaxID=59839 RepID=UPI0022835AC1